MKSIEIDLSGIEPDEICVVEGKVDFNLLGTRYHHDIHLGNCVISCGYDQIKSLHAELSEYIEEKEAQMNRRKMQR